ncbi:hypothetical protein psyc5s11_54990 [Clostridium gelidum]|uniref:DUF4376 domain-containing protein n=1 Tax=Clostridium gelidum TaxID=704125 RepID=A0ABM7TBW1_9CLOT|nr:hypothetical protein [Clostridium gelidum]BCZ49432.1 hypothetical protein psyc5s11_54990 [Clostridium gelidum]
MDFDKVNYVDGVLYIQKDDGLECIDETIAKEDEKTIITAFKMAFPNGKPILVTLEDIQIKKITEMSGTCEDIIINKFYSTCLGDSRRFDCTDRDQANIQGLVAKAQLILSGMATDNLLDWKESGVAECYPFTTTQAIMLGSDLFNHITEKKKRYEKLKVYILKQTEIEVIQAVTWDTDLEGDVSEK